MPDFLLEIGTEEIPARMIQDASQELQKRVEELLAKNSLPHQGIKRIGNPAAAGADCVRHSCYSTGRAGATYRPGYEVAYKDGQPTPAAHAFAKKAGVDVSQSGEGDDAERRVSDRDGHEQGQAGRTDSGRTSAQRDRGHLLAQEYVLARRQAGAICAAGALDCGDARWRGYSAGVRGHQGRESVAWTSHSWPGAGCDCFALAIRRDDAGRACHGFKCAIASTRSARLWMLPREPFPAHAGAKMPNCSRPW